MRFLPRLLLALGLLAVAVPGQQGPTDAEQAELRTRLAEAGSSPVEFTRVLERHLEKYPQTAQRAEIERALARSAVEQQDSRRVLLYGQRVLAREPDELLFLERVTRLLLQTGDLEQAKLAQGHAERFDKAIRAMRPADAAPASEKARMTEDLQRGVARALLFRARAAGIQGRTKEALELARQAYATHAHAESAREVGRWLAASNQPLDAVRLYADAFALADDSTTPAERAADRTRMGELYQEVKGSETGLGDLLLQSIDRIAALTSARERSLAQADPNAAASAPLDFTISSVDGGSLALSSLKGKVVVLDFWATWCGPCRIQQPLYEKVKERFRDRNDVVFLAISTDEDRSLVAPFLAQQKWSKQAYFDDGLGKLLKVSSIPTTMVLSRQGEIVSRMNGFLPDRFVDMLTDRISEALKPETAKP